MHAQAIKIVNNREKIMENNKFEQKNAGPYSCYQCKRQSIIRYRGQTVKSKVWPMKFQFE